MLRPPTLVDGKMHIGPRIDGTSTENECLLGVNNFGVMDADIFTTYVTIELLPKKTAYTVTSCVKVEGKISVQ